MADDVIFYCPVGGMNGAGDPGQLSQAQYRRAVNVMLRDQLPGTRWGVRVYALESPDSIDAEFFSRNNVQGVKFFNPAKGQGGLSLGKDESMMVAACGGRKFTVKPEGDGAQTRMLVRDISNGHFGSSLLHTVWWCCAENYAIATDGVANTFIYDADTDTASESTGYDSVNKESSRFPNGATVSVYAHSRILTVVNQRQILAGDSLHKVDQSSAVNLLGFTEQTYWNTGQYFMPPSSMGNITAAEILPIQDEQHGHADVLFHCTAGVFSLFTNIAPRSRWSSEAIAKPALSEAGATGPYAVSTWNGDQLFRTQFGVSTLRNARASAAMEGSPNAPFSEPVDTFFASDVQDWLRFCSAATWTTAKRCLITADPCVDGRFRWHRGVVVRNFAPVPAERSAACWEGLWTLPAQAAGIVQMVSGLFPNDRLFAFCLGSDGKNRVVEFTTDLIDDVLEDGTRQKIRCQLISRQIDFQQPFNRKEFLHGELFVRGAKGRVDWGVWIRAHGSSEWVFWNNGYIQVSETSDEFGLVESEPFTGGIPLGDIPKECAVKFGNSRSMQFLIRWAGHMQIETLRIEGGKGEPDSVEVSSDKFRIIKSDPLYSGYDDFEYNGEPVWLTELNK